MRMSSEVHVYWERGGIVKNKRGCSCLEGWAPLTDYAHLPLIWNCG